MKEQISDYLKRKMVMLSLALANVEKDAFGQNGEVASNEVNQEQRKTQGTLADSLVNGEITQEVMALRWRTYKILESTKGLTAKITGYDSDGMPIVKTQKKDVKNALKKMKQDDFDSYQLEMVVDNSSIISSIDDVMGNKNINTTLEPIINKDKDDNVISATLGEITSIEYFATNKGEKPIIIDRDNPPTFRIEDYTKKLHVRQINEKEKLLEFYISKYPDENNRNSRLLISEIKKIIKYNKPSSLLDFTSVLFITDNTMGVKDFLEYQFKIKSFNKIVEFNGNYIIKFIGETIINGENIVEKYIVDKLDEKYKNKVKK